MEHPSNETLVRFGRLQATRAEHCEVVGHLLRGCPGCAERLHAVIWPKVAPGDYDEIVDRVCDKILRPRRPGSWAKLLPFEKPGMSQPAGKS